MQLANCSLNARLLNACIIDDDDDDVHEASLRYTVLYTVLYNAS